MPVENFREKYKYSQLRIVYIKITYLKKVYNLRSIKFITSYLAALVPSQSLINIVNLYSVEIYLGRYSPRGRGIVPQLMYTAPEFSPHPVNILVYKCTVPPKGPCLSTRLT